MQTKFKRHQKVIILIDPNPEYLEYEMDFEGTPVKKGMQGEINLLLPNGQYHVKIFDKKGNVIAYAPMSEEDMDSIEE